MNSSTTMISVQVVVKLVVRWIAKASFRVSWENNSKLLKCTCTTLKVGLAILNVSSSLGGAKRFDIPRDMSESKLTESFIVVVIRTNDPWNKQRNHFLIQAKRNKNYKIIGNNLRGIVKKSHYLWNSRKIFFIILVWLWIEITIGKF